MVRYLLFAAFAAAFVLVTVHVATEAVAGNKVGAVSPTTHMLILPPGSRATILNLDY
jgi:hypothetical protein